MALGSRTRWAIFTTVRDNPSHIGNLAKVIKKNKSTVSRHVDVLERVGLVRTVTVDGRRGKKKKVYPVAPRIYLDLS